MERINQFLRELTGADYECVSFEIPEASKKMCNDLFSFQYVCDFIYTFSRITSGSLIYRSKYIVKMINYVWDGIVNAKYNRVLDTYFSLGSIPSNNLTITVSGEILGWDACLHTHTKPKSIPQGETHCLFIDLNLWDCVPKYWPTCWYESGETEAKEENYPVILLLLNLVNLTERDNNFKLALTNAMHDYGAKHISSYSFILWNLEQIDTLPNDCIAIIIRFFWLCQFF